MTLKIKALVEEIRRTRDAYSTDDRYTNGWFDACTRILAFLNDNTENAAPIFIPVDKCPFCGGAPHWDENGPNAVRIVCRRVDCFGPATPFYGNREDAARAWNRRAQPTAVIARCAQIARDWPEYSWNEGTGKAIADAILKLGKET